MDNRGRVRDNLMRKREKSMLGKGVSARARLGVNRRGGERTACSFCVEWAIDGGAAKGSAADVSEGGMSVLAQSVGGSGIPSIGEEFMATLTSPDGRSATVACSTRSRQRVGMLGSTYRLGLAFSTREARRAVGDLLRPAA